MEEWRTHRFLKTDSFSDAIAHCVCGLVWGSVELGMGCAVVNLFSEESWKSTTLPQPQLEIQKERRVYFQEVCMLLFFLRVRPRLGRKLTGMDVRPLRAFFFLSIGFHLSDQPKLIRGRWASRLREAWEDGFEREC